MLSGYAITEAASFISDWFSNKEHFWQQLPTAIHKEYCQQLRSCLWAGSMYVNVLLGSILRLN